MDKSKSTKKIAQSFLNPWPTMRLIFGMFFFGMAGSCNDINFLQRSPLITRIALNEGPQVEFVANGRKYNYGKFLADDTYPRWRTFVKPVVKPKGKK
jgi:hypothetical protein